MRRARPVRGGPSRVVSSRVVSDVLITPPPASSAVRSDAAGHGVNGLSFGYGAATWRHLPVDGGAPLVLELGERGFVHGLLAGCAEVR